MPFAPRRYCPVPGCPHLQPCAVHPKPTHGWTTNRREDVTRLAGRANQERRQRLFQREPLCRHCAERGLVTAATIADHIIPLAEGGADTDANLQVLCTVCHNLKSREESARGKQRAR